MPSDTARRTGELHRGVTEEISVLLLRRRMTAQDLARKLGWSQSAMSRRMVGDQPFDLDELQRIAELFGVTIADLLPRDQREVTLR
jgi:transcriptional regulator with XRE-family HTH domain